MSFEVAALHATLGVRTEGFAEASRFTQQLSAAQKAMEQSAGSASASVQILRNELQASVDALQRFANVTEFNNELLKGFGQTTQSIGPAIAAARVEADKATKAYEAQNAAITASRARYDQLVKSADAARKEYGSLSVQAKQAQQAVIEGNKAVREQTAQLSGLRVAASRATQELHQLQVAESVLIDDTVFAAGQLQQAANVERATLRVNRALGQQTRVQRDVARQTQVSQTTLSGLVSAMRTGNIGSSVLAQGMQFLTSRMGLLAIGLGAAAIGFVTMGVKMASTANEIRKLNPQFLELAESLGRIQGLDLVAVTNQLQLLSNRLESFGAGQGEQAATEIARLGQQLAFLRPGADDAEGAIQAISRSIETLNAEQLRDFGVNVAALEAELERLADAGYGEAAQRAAVFAAVQNHVLANSKEIQAATERETSTFASLGAEFKRAFQSVAASEQVQSVMRDLVDTFKDLTVIGKPVLQFLGLLFGIVVRIVNGALRIFQLAIAGLIRAFSFLVRAGAAIPGALGDSFENLADTTLGFAKEIEGAVFNTDQMSDSVRLGREELFQFGDAAGQARDRVQEFNDSVSGGFSIVGSIRSIGEAWDEMQADLSPRTTIEFVEGIDRAMGLLAEHGTQSLDNLRARLQGFLDAGFINQAQFDELTRGLGTIEQVAGPLIDEVKRIESAYGDNASQAQTTATTNNTMLQPSIVNVGNAAATAAGQVGSLTSALHSVPSSISTSISVTGGTIPGGAIGAAIAGRTGPHVIGGGEGGLGGLTGPGGALIAPVTRVVNEGLERFRRFGAATAPIPEQRIPDFGAVADAFRAPEKADTGGGGGGSLATIEQIRDFFRQMNQAIKIGVNNNIRFGTAGNTIPTGGIGEFLNTAGGDIIQTINLRGVWDFADPAAKREVIRQLRELLGELGREDA